MTPEESRNQQTLWWITSIAISVVCCSVLFILFASYLVDIKNGLRDNDLRINNVEEREDRILAEIELLRAHTVTIGAPATPATAGQARPATPDSGAAVVGTSAPGTSGAAVTAPMTQPTPTPAGSSAPASSATPAPAAPAAK